MGSASGCGNPTAGGWPSSGLVRPEDPVAVQRPGDADVVVRVTGRVAFPTTDAIEGDSTTLTRYLERFAARPREMGVELRGLGDYTATAELTV